MRTAGADNVTRGGRRLEGARVVVIGGSSGIGLASAEAAYEAGAAVVIVGRARERLERAKARIGDGVSTFALDVTDEAAVKGFFSRLGRVDHLVVSAAETTATRIEDAEYEEVRSTLDIRLWGGLYAAKHAAPAMDGGSITFMSGTSSWRPYLGSSIVAASSGAIEALARTLALELAPTRVNTICSGFVDTPLLEGFYGEQREEVVRELAARLPVRRIGRPEDIADGVVFLMGNGFVTGTVLHIDGGKLLV